MKSPELTGLAAEVSRQSSIDCATWLLVTALRQIYNEEEQAQQGKMKTQLEEKRSPRKCNVAAKSYV